MSEVQYRISTKISSAGYHSINKEKGFVIVNPSNLRYSNFDEFIIQFIYILILERICLERAHNKIKMKNRCKPICKVAIITDYIFWLLNKNKEK